MKTSHPLMSVTGSLEGGVLEVLAGSTEAMPLGDVHRLVGAASKSGVRKAIMRLVDGGIVEQVPGGYRLNRDHVASDAIMELATLRRKVFDRIEAEIRSWSAHIAVAGVFGSVARGEGDEDSDVDVLVVGDDLPVDAVGRLSTKVARWTGNDCHVVTLTLDDLDTAIRSQEPIIKSWRDELVVLCGDRNVLSAPVQS